MRVYINDCIVVVKNIFEEKCFIYDRLKRLEYDINYDCFEIINDIKNNCYSRKKINEIYDKEFINKLFELDMLTTKKQKNINNVKSLEKHNNARIFVELTNKCNLNCKHCYGGFAAKNNKSIPLNLLKKVIDNASIAGTYQLDLTGGEPTLYPELEELLEYAYNSGMIVRIFTNLTTFCKRIEDILNKYCVKCIVTSLDSCIAEEHDVFRGKKGSFTKTLSAIDILKREGFEISLNTMIGTHNKDHINELIDFIKKLEVNSVLDVIVPEGRALNLNEDIIDSAKVIKKIYKDNEKNINKESLSIGCGVGNRFVYIKSDGNIYLCPSLIESEYKICDIQDFDIDFIWNLLEKKYKKLGCNKKNEKCNKCTGGCRSRARILHGSIYDEDDVYCIINGVKKT